MVGLRLLRISTPKQGAAVNGSEKDNCPIAGDAHLKYKQRLRIELFNKR